MRKYPRNEPSSTCRFAISKSSVGFPFGKAKIVFLVLSVGALLFSVTIGWSAASIIHVVQFQSSASANGLPRDWFLQEYKGTPSFRVNQDAQPPHLHMMSSGETAFGFRKEVHIDVRSYPYLYWSWKATKLPDGGDVRGKDSDDQCIQIYLALQIPGDGWFRSTSPSIAYIWDNKAPKNILARSPQAMLGNVRYLVLRNGKDKLGTWFTEKRNILSDLRRAFGEHSVDAGPVVVKGVLLFINTHHTRSEAEGSIGNIYFSDQ